MILRARTTRPAGPAPKAAGSPLREHVRAHADNRPGIYRMIGPDGEVLYVGKSVRIRTRLLSYFRARPGQKAAEIVSLADRIEWEYVSDEFAALLRELRLIKRWRPRFNREHKRDGGYSFIKLTREAAPRFIVVGTVRNDGARYYGPFRHRRRLRDAVREVADLLALRDCAAKTPMRFADQVELFERVDPPLCMRADLDRCIAPCAAGCTRRDYLARIARARRFLEGATDGPLEALRDRMRDAAERMQFEYAAALRDRADRLEKVRNELVGLSDTLGALSFVYRPHGFEGEDRVYVIQRGAVRAEFPAPRTAMDRRRIERAAAELLGGVAPPIAAVEPRQIAEMLLVSRWFRRNPAELERTFRP